jgi:UDP-2,3-diacylglucosamine hydrolase
MESEYDVRRSEGGTRYDVIQIMNDVRKCIYFASDAHLGTRYLDDPMAAEKKLVRWLDSIKPTASAVWFLGDIFDYWYEYKYVVPKGHVRFLGKLAELSDSGIEIHIFVGNHDVWMFDYLPKEIGAIIHRDVLTVDLLGSRFFLGHGDEIDYRSWAYQLMRKVFRNRFIQLCYAAIHPRWTFGFAFRWSLSSRTSALESEKRKDSSKDYGYLVDFATKYSAEHPDINYFIFGHRHVMVDQTISPTCRLLVAGDWMKIFSYIVWDGQTLRLLKYEG